MMNAFREAGIKEVLQVNAHSIFLLIDINFALGKYGRESYHIAQKEMVTIAKDDLKIEDRLDWRIEKSVKDIQRYLKENPNSDTDNKQLNLAGRSMGSSLKAQTALKLADAGTAVDNLILIGSTISPDSELGKTLEKYKQEVKIKNVIYKNTTGDEVVQTASKGLKTGGVMEIIKKLLLGSKVGSKHSVLAGNKDDIEANNEKKRVAKELVAEGVI